MKKKKICLAASSGGHLEQVLMLKPLLKEYEGFILTEKTSYTFNVEGVRVYRILQVNRKEWTCFLKMFINAIYSFKIFIKEKPQVIICTGVLAMIPMCLIVKLFGGKLIYIESIAKSTSPTLTGKLLYKYADRFYVQWETMLDIYPKAVYKGNIY